MDSSNELEDIIKRCQELGINCIAVSDHGTAEGGRRMQELAPFPVIVAEEILTPHGEIMGMFLKETVPSNITVEEAIARIKEQDALVCIPHPFDTLRPPANGCRLEKWEVVPALSPPSAQATPTPAPSAPSSTIRVAMASDITVTAYFTCPCPPLDTSDWPRSGIVNQSMTFPLPACGNNPSYYWFDWGDNTNSGWASCTQGKVSHLWAKPGTYSVRAIACCVINNNWDELEQNYFLSKSNISIN